MSGTWDVIEGDCLERLREIDYWVDAVVTDPPAGISFMGASWDGDKGGREQWIAWLTEVAAELLRVLKPGGHALVWALPRTSHWTGMALDLAGFEIRDRVSHMFGTGFPKSLDVSKAIDKAAGAKRRALRPVARPAGNRNGTNALGGGWQDTPMVTAPATAAAAAWEGWGTALKPGGEDWWLVRKPLEGTVAQNVEAWGVGALNIDATRIGEGSLKPVRGAPKNTGEGSFGMGSRSALPDSTEGRWPANVVLDEDAAVMLDAQSGEAKPKAARQGKRGGSNAAHMSRAKGDNEHQDSEGFWPADPGGGASRFFYCAKPSNSERNAGLADNVHPTVKPIALMRWLVRMITPPGGLVLDPFCGSGTTGAAAVLEGCRFVGIEQEPGFAEIARKRIAHWEKQRE